MQTRRPIIWTAHAVHVPAVLSPIDGRCTSKEMDGIDGTQTSRETIAIDLIKSARIGAANSQLLQRMDPPLGSDLHYGDK